MGFLRIILAALAVAGLAWNANAGQASTKLSDLAGSLINAYAAKAGAGKATLAVFPFSCDDKLKKQRVGFAVAELMSHRFVADGNFIVVERGEIDKLLTEQRLQSSGVTDSATAVKLGKLAGAGVLLLGNLNKVDGYYQVNARIVNAETGEVMASGYTELGVEAFEDDARVYLNLVPQEQTLGIYGVYNYRYNSNDLPSFTENQWGEVTNNPHSFAAKMLGGGLLYRPRRNIQINAEVITNIGGDKYIKMVHYYTSPSPGSFVEEKTLKMTSVSLTASYVGQLSAKWHYLAGMGLQHLVSGVSEAREDIPPSVLAKAGIEYKPQSRIGLGVNVKYEFKPVKFQSEYTDGRMMELNPLSFETVLAFYF